MSTLATLVGIYGSFRNGVHIAASYCLGSNFSGAAFCLHHQLVGFLLGLRRLLQLFRTCGVFYTNFCCFKLVAVLAVEKKVGTIWVKKLEPQVVHISPHRPDDPERFQI